MIHVLVKGKHSGLWHSFFTSDDLTACQAKAEELKKPMFGFGSIFDVITIWELDCDKPVIEEEFLFRCGKQFESPPIPGSVSSSPVGDSTNNTKEGEQILSSTG